MRARKTIGLILTLAILLTSRGTAFAQSTGVQYFAETGHSVKGAFLQFYRAAKDPLLVYGYPITEQMKSIDGRIVQYFQRARFELTSNQTIGLTPLGINTYRSTSPIVINNPSACKVFNGIPVCFDFLKFYEDNGGQAQFGNPISPFESSNKIIVQYFEKARFEWRADRPEGERVVISELGRVYYDQLKEDPARLKSIDQPDATISPILALKIRAFVLKAVTSSSGLQTVYIVVHSQTSRPVVGATGTALVTFTNGTINEFPFITDDRGIAHFTFDFSNQKSGELVPIDITVSYLNLSTTTKASFRTWF